MVDNAANTSRKDDTQNSFIQRTRTLERVGIAEARAASGLVGDRASGGVESAGR